jgi:hypothetical protein
VRETPYPYKATARRALRRPAAVRNVPVIGFAIATPDQDGYFDDADYPPGAGEGYLRGPRATPMPMRCACAAIRCSRGSARAR